MTDSREMIFGLGNPIEPDAARSRGPARDGAVNGRAGGSLPPSGAKHDPALERALTVMATARRNGASAMDAAKAAIDAGFDHQAALEDCRAVNAARIRELIGEIRSLREQRDAAHRLLADQSRIIGKMWAAIEAAVVNALDIDGVPDRASISYGHLNDLNAAIASLCGND